jgi:hypothetical protein
MSPRVFDSIREIEVVDESFHVRKGDQRPVPPAANGDGTIFVSIASYRGTWNARNRMPILENASVSWNVPVGWLWNQL